MSIHRPLVFAALVAAVFGAVSASATPVCSIADINVATAPYSGSGCLLNDASEQSFLFSADSTGAFNLFTTSWASGGFAPELALFDGSGNFLASDSGGIDSDDPEINTCGARQVANFDFAGNTCLDAFLTRTLTPGAYRLVLSQHFNDPTGSYVPSGSPEQSHFYSKFGQLSFTGQTWNQNSDRYLSPNDGFPMANLWSVTISPEASSVGTPEPVAWILALSGIFAVSLVARRRSLMPSTTR